REVPDRRHCPAPHISFPRRHLRRRPHLLQHGGVVAGHPPRCPPAEGPALLSPARRERGDDLRRPPVGAEPAARRQRQAGRAPAGRRVLHGDEGRPLRPPPDLQLEGTAARSQSNGRSASSVGAWTSSPTIIGGTFTSSEEVSAAPSTRQSVTQTS